MRLDQKVAVVTGGASGIGAACAALLAAEGGRVAVLDLQPGSAELSIVCDVSREDQVRAAMQRIAETWGRVDVLLNNAGIAARQPVGDVDEPTWTRVFDTNAKGAYLCSKHALPHFTQMGGSIIHMASVTGITGVRNRPAYSAAKGALISLTRNMAVDYASRRIRVNCVCPGFVRTPLIAPLLADSERSARLLALHPLGRLGEPEDIARAVLFLACDDSAWMTGQSLVIDGGFAAGHTAEI